jgi:predicted acetyltransferase
MRFVPRPKLPAGEAHMGRPPPVDRVFDIEFVMDLAPLVDGDLEVVLSARVPADHENGYSPVYRFKIFHSKTHDEMGGINLRVGRTHNEVNYRGNVGFFVHERYRGHHYAERSCRLIVPIAKHHALNPVWITCNDGNSPSIRTIERLGAVYVETLTMPDDYPYARYCAADARTKRRYRWDLP